MCEWPVLDQMLRCAFAVTTAFAVCLPAAAQVQRNFPQNALRGVLSMEQPPNVLMNGQPARLAPGSRIRDQNNLVRVSGVLTGQRATVHYTIDTYGLIKDVWILTPTELERRPWPSTPAEAARWRFDPIGQFWSRP
jgi:hypothetical protein